MILELLARRQWPDAALDDELAKWVSSCGLVEVAKCCVRSTRFRTQAKPIGILWGAFLVGWPSNIGCFPMIFSWMQVSASCSLCEWRGRQQRLPS